MSRSRAAGGRKKKQTAATVIEMIDADDDRPQQTADAAAAAADNSAVSSSSRPRRSAAAHAQLKLLQQAFESERPPVSSQTAATNGQQTAVEPAGSAGVPATAAAAIEPEAPRRRGRQPKQNGAHIAATATPMVKRAVTGKRVRFAQSFSSESMTDIEMAASEKPLAAYDDVGSGAAAAAAVCSSPAEPHLSSVDCKKSPGWWPGSESPEYYAHLTSVSNGLMHFTDQLCEMLQRGGADFHLPDNDGFIPLLGLVTLAKKQLVSGRLLSSVIFRQRKRKKAGDDADRTLPIDLNITDSVGNPLLAILFEKPTYSHHEQDWKGREAVWLTIAKKLCIHSDRLAQVDLFAVDSSGRTIIHVLADTCGSVQRRRSKIPVQESTFHMPRRLFKAWQAQRRPILKSPLEVWLIPDLSDICCEYLLGPAKDGVAMSPREHKRVFGVRPFEEMKQLLADLAAMTAALDDPQLSDETGAAAEIEEERLRIELFEKFSEQLLPHPSILSHQPQ